MSEQPATRTPVDLTSNDFAEAFVSAFQDVMNREPSRNEADWLTSILHLENAGGRSIYNWNFGNRTALKNDDYWVPPWADMSRDTPELTPREQAVRARMLAGEDVPRKFAAFPSMRVGLRKFVKLFTSETNARILTAADRNDAHAFRKAIGTPHPRTHMRYCMECDTDEVEQSYLSIHDRTRESGVFDFLGPAAGAAGA
jgi:hypothetical protein